MSRPFSKKISELLQSASPPKWASHHLQQRREQLARWRKPDVPFLVGQKNVYLPNFTIALIRNKRNLSPWWATFKVPLNFNKLDLRDYLFHAYNVRVHSIRSSIRIFSIQQIQRDDPRALPGKRQFYRPRSEKRMTVELERPFVWPEAPSGRDLEKWDHSRYIKYKDAQMASSQGQHVVDEASRKERVTKLREQAKQLLSGEKKWRADVSVGAMEGAKSEARPTA